MLVLAGDLYRRILVGAEAQQGGNPANAVELLVVADVNNLDTAANECPTMASPMSSSSVFSLPHTAHVGATCMSM